MWWQVIIAIVTLGCAVEAIRRKVVSLSHVAGLAPAPWSHYCYIYWALLKLLS